MAQPKIKTCVVCRQSFEGRSNAKTCSAKCRKRLSRARQVLAHEAYEVKSAAEHFKHLAKETLKEIEGDLTPYATEEGFVEAPVKTAADMPQTAYQAPSAPNTPISLDVTPSAMPTPASTPALNVPSDPSSLFPSTPAATPAHTPGSVFSPNAAAQTTPTSTTTATTTATTSTLSPSSPAASPQPTTQLSQPPLSEGPLLSNLSNPATTDTVPAPSITIPDSLNPTSTTTTLEATPSTLNPASTPVSPAPNLPPTSSFGSIPGTPTPPPKGSRFGLPKLPKAAKFAMASVALISLVAIGTYLLGNAQGQGKAHITSNPPTTNSTQAAITDNATDQAIHLNRATFIDNGQPLTASGPVNFKNNANSVNAFTVQDASGASIINVDTSTGVVTVTTLQGSGSLLANLNASNISSGTLTNNRLTPQVTLLGNSFNGAGQLVQLDSSGNLPPANGSLLIDLNASQILIGTLSDTRLSSNVPLKNTTNNFTAANTFVSASGTFTGNFVGDGSGLTNLNATNLASGTVNDARLSANVDLLNANQTITGSKTLSGNNTFNGTNTFNGQSNFNGVTIQNGNFLFQSATNSVGAFQIQNAAGNDHLLVADTINTRIGIGTAIPNYTLDVNGDVNVSAGHTFRINGTDVCSSGLCNPSSGSGFYINNTNNLQANANFNIQSANSTFVGGIIKGATGQTADLFEGQNSAGTIVYALDPNGNVNITGQYEINGAPLCTAGGCTAASGSGSYVQNGIALQANANFNIESAAAG